MKTNLNDKLVEILTSIQSAAGKAGDFAMEQLPDIVQSYILYGRIKYTMGFIFFLFLLFLSSYISIKHGLLNKDAVDRDGEWRESRALLFLLPGVASFFLLIPVVFTFPDFALVWAAPKVWLLKEIGGMLK